MIAFVQKFQSQVFFTLFTVACRLLNKYVHQIDKAFSTTSALVSLSSDQTVFLEELPNQLWRSNTGEQWQDLKQ